MRLLLLQPLTRILVRRIQTTSFLSLSNIAFEIADVSASLPELLRRPGLTTWRPTANRAVSKTYVTFEEFLGTLSEQQKAETKLTAGHWPPPNVAELHLENWYVTTRELEHPRAVLILPLSIRIYPHLQDTGGFFVAVLQKKAGYRKDSNDPKCVRSSFSGFQRNQKLCRC
jgi:multisite-specific tRNA:(cytosine-C5)-methyltransferase